nr:S-adenosylmethionine decarboxylase [uncultured Carboxylicivirga sp.]
MTKINAVNLPPKIFNIKGWIELYEPIELKEQFDTALNKSGFKILQFTDHKFPENGYTAFWLLAESHFAVHTFDQDGCSYIELSSCNKQKALNFITLCKQFNFTFQWENDLEELNCNKNVNA